ncbi:MAG: methyltetrahydrofolate cobalamin methyltransferase [Deltaproteobacteria bacterium]|nr:methyltetrahydrofolate cobalamin methyltransferase [Deltaproteobacteria bacterium]
MLIIGEKINGTRKEVARAVAERDAEFIRNLARSQAEAGADFLDVNAGTKPEREPEDLVWLVQVVQEAVEKPLCLDSPNPRALAAALKEVRTTPMVNSISGEPERLSGILPLAAEHGCSLIALALDDSGIPKGTEGRLAVIRRLFAETRRAGVPDGRIYVDPLAMAVATDNQACTVALETIRTVHEEFPEAHFTAGLSNVSFGLPARSLVNQAFLSLALAAGLDSAILDPTDRGLMATLLATEVVLGRDRYCMNYSKAFRSGRLGGPA